MIERFLEIEPVTVLLLLLLIAAFIFAFKVLRMIIQTVTVAFISGIFYIALVYVLGVEFSVDRILLFSFLGATFYMLYSFLISAYSIAAKVISIPYKLTYLILYIPLRHVLKHLEEVKTDLKNKAEEEKAKEEEIKNKVREKVRKNKD